MTLVELQNVLGERIAIAQNKELSIEEYCPNCGQRLKWGD